MEFGELIDEAFEQAGLDPASITHRHISSLKRSLDLLYIEIENEGLEPEYRTSTEVYPLIPNQGGIILPSDTIDVCDVSYRSQGIGIANDAPMTRINRHDFMSYTQKTQTGRPSNYWVSKSSPGEMKFSDGSLSMAWGDAGISVRHADGSAGAADDLTADHRVLIVWPANTLAATSVVVTRVRWSKMANGIMDNIDGARAWLDTIASGLATRTAQKFNYERYGDLKIEFESKLKQRSQAEDMAPVNIAFRAYGLPRRRRR